jgi:hypothetical protein
LVTTNSVKSDDEETVEVTTFGAAREGEPASRTAATENENALRRLLIVPPVKSCKLQDLFDRSTKFIQIEIRIQVAS